MQKTDLNIRDSYKIYEEKKVNIKDYIIICNNFNKFLFKHVLEGFEVVLPSRLGTFQVVGNKLKLIFNEDGTPKLAPDWKKTKELWDSCEECKEKKQRVFHTNDHSSGIRYKMFWSKKRVLIKYKSLYSFRLSRDNKRDIHKGILNGKEYLVKS